LDEILYEMNFSEEVGSQLIMFDVFPEELRFVIDD
jgi:hypothetical protein